MNVNEEWKEIEGMNIRSDRNAENGEKICIFVIDLETDEILEKNILIPNEAEAEHYTWPMRLSESINRNSNYIRAGELSEDGNIIPIGSQHRNKLWRREHSELIAYPTNCCLDTWKKEGTLSSAGSVIPGTKMKISVISRNHGLLYEALTFVTDDETSSMYSWPYYLSEHINDNSIFLRAGEKNQESKLITPLHSAYRNIIWVPNGSNYKYNVEYEHPNGITQDAEQVYRNALSTLTTSNRPSQDLIDGWLQGFSQGKFSDISYPQNNAGTNTAPLYEHLNRTKDLANYIHHKAISESDTYYTAAVEALHFYASQNFQTTNWWDRQIGLASIVAQTLIILTDKPPSSQLSECILYLRKTTNTSMGLTGANLADFAYIQLLWALSGWKNDGLSSFLDEAYAASDAISSLCLPVARHGKERGEGISIDNSFSQHNPQSGRYSQLYAGSYGTVFLDSVFKTQSILCGVFSLSKAALRSIEGFIINGMGWFSYAGLYDFHACGRAISRGMKASNALAGWCRQLMGTSPEHLETLQELIRRANGDEGANRFYLGCRAYWVNDYIAKISEKHCLWAKVISSRTVASESGLGENLKGYYMGCGSYFITRTGNEYRNIQPLWDWQRVPGTTVEQVENFEYPLIEWGDNNWGSDDFSGVISNGATAIATMILSRGNVKLARKSVIALPDKNIFIGSSIDNSWAERPVYTSVNQCKLNGDVEVHFSDGGREFINLGQRITSDKIVKISHDGLHYSFPTPQVITVQAALQTGSWREINRNGSSDNLSGEVFSVWVEHERGNDESYYYEIADAQEATSATPTQAFHDSLAHIVTDSERKFTAAVIYTADGYDIELSNVKLRALGSFALIASVRDNGLLELTLADMTQKMTKADFLFTWGRVTSLTSFPLPGGDDRGKSITYLVAPVTQPDK